MKHLNVELTNRVRLSYRITFKFKTSQKKIHDYILIRDWSKSIEGGGPEQRGGGS